jgi:hypothetical protein
MRSCKPMTDNLLVTSDVKGSAFDTINFRSAPTLWDVKESRIFWISLLTPCVDGSVSTSEAQYRDAFPYTGDQSGSSKMNIKRRLSNLLRNDVSVA